MQLLPSIRRRNYYITDVVVAASSAAAFNAATTTSNQPTFRSGTDARSAGRISPPTLPEIGCCFVIVRLFMISKLPDTTLRLGIVDCLIAAAVGGSSVVALAPAAQRVRCQSPCGELHEQQPCFAASYTWAGREVEPKPLIACGESRGTQPLAALQQGKGLRPSGQPEATSHGGGLPGQQPRFAASYRQGLSRSELGEPCSYAASHSYRIAAR